jgi:cytochrome c oxidase subunit IV
VDDMTDREVEQAAAQVARVRVQGWRLRACAVALMVATFALRGAARPLAAALLALMSLIVAADLVRAARLRMMVERLALEPAAYAIEAVRQFGARAASSSQCELLARRLRDVMANATEQPLVPERVQAYQAEIEELSARLGRPGARLGAPEAVACRRLLTRCADSALYNRRIPAEDLGAALRRIAAGIS